ncbi:PAS domain-containing protein [Halomicroarcula sp. F28]|uniref:sensor histidine kinase n=1 Tax=Haloarcula salinisoli TaxID=2487746 RepID=UPI001C7388F4|nr:histidine kinase N-terminal 7TM domain-containing protein [Halomicroarcula salinisoli]MBX0285172.1 PAS domain-containing protein [Halomicroarcula salinisoli]
MVAEAWTVAAIQAFGGLVSLSFLRLALSNRQQPASRSFAAFVVAIALWSFALAATNLTAGPRLSLAAYNVAILGAELAAATWLLLAMTVSTWVTVRRWTVAGLGGWILLMQALLWTNPWHYLFLAPETGLAGTVVLPVYATGFWIHALVGNAIVLSGLGILVFEALTTTGLRRRQAALLALAVVPLLVMNALAVSDALLAPYDFTPLGFLVTAFVFLVVLFRGRLLDIAPIARRTAMGEMHDAVVTLDERDRVVDCNRTARELFDQPNDYVGLPAASFFGRIAEDICSQFEAGPTVETTVDGRINGTQYYFSMSSVPIEGISERGRVVVLHDITDEKQRELELERKNERLNQFAGVVSHDLRNPLMVVTSHLELARDDVPADHADPMAENLERMETMIDDLLAMARAGQTVEETEPVLLHGAAEEAWSHLKTPGATFENAFAEETVVEAERNRLLHVFENLYRNAFEHNDAALTVRVGPLGEASTAGGVEGFFVADDGAGIPEAERDEVFEQGYTTATDGSGFGLTFVRDIVEAHGWDIHVQDSVSGGARFEITGLDAAE